jgi:CCR4-NOT transcription complex subunit 1
VSVNSNVALFQAQPALMALVPVAVDRAIREIIQPVIERSVNVAAITTEQLVLKDFAMEPDAAKMREAARLMISHLAGSLALVTCQEPLRVAMGTHLRSILGPQCADSNLLSQVVQICTADNLELACVIIEKAAAERGCKTIEEKLAVALAARRKHVADGGAMPFFDSTFFQPGRRWPAALSDALRPKPGGLQLHQLRVYEAFGRPVLAPSQAQREASAVEAKATAASPRSATYGGGEPAVTAQV